MQALFLACIILSVYYPSLFGPINSVDDDGMIRSIMQIDRIDLKELFFPSGHRYYRPILVLSFHFDNFTSGCNPFSMHLHNVLLHTLNSLLVFVMARMILVAYSIKITAYAPLCIALLFGLHPVNTEAVNWISGRTDLLAAFFCFASLTLTLTSTKSRLLISVLAALLYFCGLLSKEVSIALLPILVVHFFWTNNNSSSDRPISSRLFFVLPFVLVTIAYFVFRGAGTVRVDIGIDTVSQPLYDSISSAGSGAVKAFGFYIKKLFFPLPLNFGIVEIDGTFYFWFGIASSLVALSIVLFRKGILGFCTVFAICFFLPAIPVALTRMAWTPLAERYIYLSSAGFSIAAVVMIFSFYRMRIFAFCFIALILSFSGYCTYERNLVWQSNITLFKDTIEKSPTFIPAYNDYAIALIHAGKFEESLNILDKAMTLPHWKPEDKYLDYLELNRTAVLLRDASPDEKKTAFKRLLKKSRHPLITHDLQIKLLSIVGVQMQKELDPSKVVLLRREALYYLSELNRDGRNEFYHYRAGQLHLQLKEKEAALASFKKAYELAPDSDYGKLADKLIRKLQNE